jgi:3-isopropylmalate/(R)-2-methylmalate dehydratase large subunit
MITWGTSPQQAIAIDGRVPPSGDSAFDTPETHARSLDYMGLRVGDALAGLPIDAAFIGSCTNSRIGDLRRAAAILEGRRVAAGVRAICVPGSTPVKHQAEAEGLDRVFREAGFEWRESGCSMCFFSGGESFGPQERVISTTNRNFESRQGPKTRTHLASPETVAASAIAGRVTDPRGVAP